MCVRVEGPVKQHVAIQPDHRQNMSKIVSALTTQLALRATAEALLEVGKSSARRHAQMLYATARASPVNQSQGTPTANPTTVTPPAMNSDATGIPELVLAKT